MLKNKNELIEGDCKVIISNGVYSGIEEFYYSNDVVITIPEGYFIVGFYQQ